MVGGIPLSEWLAPGRATHTLFPGLFRPVDAVRQRIADESSQLLPKDELVSGITADTTVAACGISLLVSVLNSKNGCRETYRRCRIC